MKKMLLFLSVIIFHCGCIAIVDDKGGEKEVKAFIVPKKEVLEILRQRDEKKPEEIRELLRIEDKGTQ